MYTFADRMAIPQLKNTCVDTVIKKMEEGGLFPNRVDINVLWETSGQVFGLRRLLIDMFATKCNLRKAIASNRSYHPRFLEALLQCLYDMKEKQTIYEKKDFWRERQNYYVGDNENPIPVD